MQVVVLPYVSFVVETNSSLRIPSARGRPAKWRAVIQMAVHNKLSVELQVSSHSGKLLRENLHVNRWRTEVGDVVQPGWNITLQTTKYNYTDVFNAKLLEYNRKSNKATFQAWRPYLTLGRLEKSFIKIMFVVEYTIAPLVGHMAMPVQQHMSRRFSVDFPNPVAGHYEVTTWCFL